MRRLSRRAALAGAGALGLGAPLAAPAIVRAQTFAPIRVGEINSYAARPALDLPYRNGWTLALQHVNDGDGVLGRQMEVLTRDDQGRPEDTLRLAGELLTEQAVDLLAGCSLDGPSLALSGFAQQNRIAYVAAQATSDDLVWRRGNHVCFRLGASAYMQAAMLVQEAAALPARRWASVAPDDGFGRAVVSVFRQLLTTRHPDSVFVAEQWPAPGHPNPAATAAALVRLKPDAVLNVLHGADLAEFVRAGVLSGLFDTTTVLSARTGDPETLDLLGERTPPGWIVTGYPRDRLNATANTEFVTEYRQKFAEPPTMGSVVGYSMIHAIAAAVTEAGGTETDPLLRGLARARFATPFGPAGFRAADHQGMLGGFVGRTAIQDGRGVMADWRAVEAASVLPTDAAARALRPKGME